LYTWAEVMQGSNSSSASPSKVKGLCPTGWHVPSDAEWTTMQSFVDASNGRDATKLKSNGDWDDSGNGTDAYGFRALPAGARGSDGSSNGAGSDSYWWSSTELDATTAWNRYMINFIAFVYRKDLYKTCGLSLRCTQD